MNMPAHAYPVAVFAYAPPVMKRCRGIPLGEGEGMPAKQSQPAMLAGLDAGARGFADHTTKDADALLLWYRSAGRMQAQAVRRYLARRIITAPWQDGYPFTSEQARLIIEHAMLFVLIPPRRHAKRRPRLPSVQLNRAKYLWLRGTVSAWLRAGIVEAVYRYAMAQE